MPGTEMKVMVDVSVATMEKATAHHGTDLLPRKYARVVFCLRPNQVPNRTIPIRYAKMMNRSSGFIPCDRCFPAKAQRRKENCWFLGFSFFAPLRLCGILLIPLYRFSNNPA